MIDVHIICMPSINKSNGLDMFAWTGTKKYRYVCFNKRLGYTYLDILVLARDWDNQI